MEIKIAFLRGINVSGHNILPMAELRGMMTGLGYEGVQTYIQSGNILFRSKETNHAKLAATLQDQIFQHFGIQSPVIIRTAHELENVLKADGRLHEKETLLDRIYYTFLADFPAAENIEKLRSYPAGSDLSTVQGKEVYLYCPGGYGSTKLNNNLIEKLLGVTATTRNLKTVQKMITLAQNAND